MPAHFALGSMARESGSISTTALLPASAAATRRFQSRYWSGVKPPAEYPPQSRSGIA